MSETFQRQSSEKSSCEDGWHHGGSQWWVENHGTLLRLSGHEDFVSEEVQVCMEEINGNYCQESIMIAVMKCS